MSWGERDRQVRMGEIMGRGVNGGEIMGRSVNGGGGECLYSKVLCEVDHIFWTMVYGYIYSRMLHIGGGIDLHVVHTHTQQGHFLSQSFFPD